MAMVKNEYESIMAELTATRNLMQDIKKDLSEIIDAVHSQSTAGIIETQEGLAEITNLISGSSNADTTGGTTEA